MNTKELLENSLYYLLKGDDDKALEAINDARDNCSYDEFIEICNSIYEEILDEDIEVANKFINMYTNNKEIDVEQQIEIVEETIDDDQEIEITGQNLNATVDIIIDEVEDVTNNEETHVNDLFDDDTLDLFEDTINEVVKDIETSYEEVSEDNEVFEDVNTNNVVDSDEIIDEEIPLTDDNSYNLEKETCNFEEETIIDDYYINDYLTKDSEETNNTNTKLYPFIGGGKNLYIAIILCIFLGGFGIHRLYDGRRKTGLVMLLMCFLSFGILYFITFFWAFYDLIIYLTKVSRYMIFKKN